MITYNLQKSKIHKIEPSDPNFNIIDQYMVVQRAAIHFDPNIPNAYAKVIAECLNNGWIKPVAYITEREKLFIGLSENNSHEHM